MLRFKTLAALLGAGLVPVLLGGCFATGPGTPLLTAATADYPFETLTVEGRFEGSDKETRLTLKRDGEKYTSIMDGEETFASFLFRKVGEDTYIVQQTMALPIFSGQFFLYAIAKKKKNEIDRLYCGNYSKDQLARNGVEILEGDAAENIIRGKICKFSSLDQLAALSKDEPAGSEEIRKLKIISSEPEKK